MRPEPCVWIFNGAGGRLPSGVFTTRDGAEVWIRGCRLTGMLTAYPLDEGTFEWAHRRGLITGRARERGDDPGFVGSFTSAIQEHYHYVDGSPAV